MTFEEAKAFVTEKIGRAPNEVEFNNLRQAWVFIYYVGSVRKIRVELHEQTKNVRVMAQPTFCFDAPIEDTAKTFSLMKKLMSRLKFSKDFN